MSFMDFEDAVKLGKNEQNDGGRPLFYLHPLEEKQADGEILMVDTIWVKIFNVGDDKNIMERPKRKEDETRWPDHWKAYQENAEPPVGGTPVTGWPYLTPADVLNLKKIHVRAVEEIVDLPDNMLRKLGVGRGFTIQKKAKEFLEYKDVDDLRARIAELEKQIGNNTDDVRERAERDRLSGTGHLSVEQQSGREDDTPTGEEISEEAVEATPVDRTYM